MTKNGGPFEIRNEHPYYIDIINFSIVPSKIRPAQVASLYLNDGLSASQVAKKLNLSKTCVLEKLRSLGIRKGTKKATLNDPKNYRAATIPYGFKKIENQLVPDKKELKICREIVRLIDKDGLSYREVGRHLVKKNWKNRSDNVVWGHTVISSIYKRWNEKI